MRIGPISAIILRQQLLSFPITQAKEHYEQKNY